MRNVLGYARSWTQGRCVINAVANQSTAQENNEEQRKNKPYQQIVFSVKKTQIKNLNMERRRRVSN